MARGFRIKFTNSDVANTHNVAIFSPSGALAFNGKIIVGVDSVNYDVPALSAGSYRLVCIVHSDMTATLAVR